MSGVVPVVPRFRFNDASGNPLAFGSVTVYLAGTTTLANTYQDKALTVANTNPVNLDANGECLFWVDGAAQYKFLLTTGLDGTGATVSGWPVDDISGASSGNARCPENYGAVGNGIADDFAALTLAMASGFHIQLTPGKTYKCAGSITATGITLYGSGTINFTSGRLILGSGARAIGIKVRGNGKTNGSHGIDTVNAADDVAIIGCDVRDTSLNGIVGRSVTKMRVIDNDLDNLGDPATITVTSQGMGVYCDNCVDVEVSGNRITRSYGQGGVFMNASTDATVSDNKISRTFFRGVEVFGAASTRVLVAGNHITRCGEINNTASGVGCNGIFVSGPTTADQVLVQGNYVAQVGENGIEGMCTIRGNTVVETGFYGGLATPSKEGIFVSGGICEDNTVISAAEEGILSFRSVATSGMRIVGNTVVNPTLTGIKVQMDGAAAVLTGSEFNRNTIHGENDAAERGVWFLTSNGGSFTSSSNDVIGNRVFGRSTNTLAGTFNENHNSFDSVHSLTMTDGSRRFIGSAMNSANGGFRRNMWSYGVDFDGTNFQADNLAQVKTYISHGNNELAIGAVPSGTTGALSSAALAAFDRIRLNDTQLILRGLPTASAGLASGEVWSNAGVLTIVP